MQNKLGVIKAFSLIEIMVVIVIISILTSLAAVSYRSYIVKARRTAVQEELMGLQQKMEEYYSLNHTYASGKACPNDVFVWGGVASSGFYNISCNLTSGYVLSAVPIGTQAKDDSECKYMSLFRNGTRKGGSSESSSQVNVCW